VCCCWRPYTAAPPDRRRHGPQEGLHRSPPREPLPRPQRPLGICVTTISRPIFCTTMTVDRTGTSAPRAFAASHGSGEPQQANSIHATSQNRGVHVAPSGVVHDLTRLTPCSPYSEMPVRNAGSSLRKTRPPPPTGSVLLFLIKTCMHLII
jgi:hypothetical protein